MARQRCPSCGGPLELRHVYDGRWLIKCDSCSLGEILTGSSREDAYLEFLDDYDNERMKPSDINRLLEQNQLVRSSNEVTQMLSEQHLRFEDLPPVVRSALTARTDYVVDYRFYRPNEITAGESFAEVGLPQELASAMGVDGLFPFQAEAAKKILEGKNVVILGPAGSGKTEAFAIPTAHLSVKKDDRPNTLFFYPTKALARDQLPRLKQIGRALGSHVAVYDGDTPQSERREIEEDPPHIILTNFDTVNAHLIHSTRFGRLLRGISAVVVDEVQVYKGVFGAHVHHILRRLRRISGPFQCIAASNVTRNPVDFCKLLFDVDFHLVEEKIGRRGPAHFVALYPTLRSATELFLDLTRKLTELRGPFIIFCSSHRLAETLAFRARRNKIEVEVHRAGLSKAHRERVESLFKMGILNCLIATPTLELGIDIGALDSIISDLVVVNRLIQRAGRAGRRGQTSIIFLIMRGNDPISQYYRDHIDQYFSDLEAAYLDATNPIVLEKHVLAAAMEKPLSREEARDAGTILADLTSKSLIHYRAGKWVANRSKAVSLLRNLDIRGAGESVRIYLRERRVGERPLPMALEELHPSAVYFMNGKPYRSIDMRVDRNGGRAALEQWYGPLDFTTRAIIEEKPSLGKEMARTRAFSIEVAYGQLSIERRVVGYVEEPVSEGKRVTKTLPNPPGYTFETKGIVMQLPAPNNYLGKKGLRAGDAASSSYHAVEHALIEGTDMITGGGADDMGGLSLGETGLVFVYDSTPGGNGASYLLYRRLEEAIGRAAGIVAGCSCMTENGCPRCTFSYRCGNDNRYLSRVGAVEVYRRVLEGEKTDLDLSVLHGTGWR